MVTVVSCVFDGFGGREVNEKTCELGSGSYTYFLHSCGESLSRVLTDGQESIMNGIIRIQYCGAESMDCLE
jgi:hypothetical protein